MRLICIAVLSLAFTACSRSADTVRDFSSRQITMPNGKTILAEVMSNPDDMSRGMMFRDSLAADRGMLFIHGSPGQYRYWMYQCRIPLDIIWMDTDRRVVEISAHTPPCTAQSSRECPVYGGHESSMYVLELGGGIAAEYGVQVGSVINF